MSFTEKLKKSINQSNWVVKMLVLLAVRPKVFKEQFLHAYADYKKFRESVDSFRKFLFESPQKTNSKGLFIMAGKAMNHQWNQLWAVLGGVYHHKGFTSYVLTSKNVPIQNLYYSLFGIKLIYLENIDIQGEHVTPNIINVVENLVTFEEFKGYELNGIPFGQIALSTFGRLRATGDIDVENEGNRQEIREWIIYLYKTVTASKKIYKEKNIEVLLFAEVFMEEYGAFYYGALTENLNIIRTVGTVRDNGIVAQHLNMESDRTHHTSVTRQSWDRICRYPDTKKIDEELLQNFLDRYGDKWALSKRNQINTKIMPIEEAKEILGIQNDTRKIAVIFSHILYDTLFFFGKDLFPCYADWFVASVKAACKNPNVQWFIKVHPSNLWRGELEHFFGGKYEEIRLIEKHIGTLPDNVKLVYPDTPISPYTWFQLSDYGVTVRGTSGLELGALGKTVITAGTGRYEDGGFTINPETADEYLDILISLPSIAEPTEDQKRRGKRYAYATFCMKPFMLDFFKPVTRTGKSYIFSTDDLVFIGNFPKRVNELPASINRFIDWSFEKESIDFMNEWPE